MRYRPLFLPTAISTAAILGVVAGCAGSLSTADSAASNSGNPAITTVPAKNPVPGSFRLVATAANSATVVVSALWLETSGELMAAQNYPATGWSTPQELAPAAHTPRKVVATAALGEITVAWVSGEGSSQEIESAYIYIDPDDTSSANQATWSSPTAVSKPGAGADNPAISNLGDASACTIAWEQPDAVHLSGCDQTEPVSQAFKAPKLHAGSIALATSENGVAAGWLQGTPEATSVQVASGQGLRYLSKPHQASKGAGISQLSIGFEQQQAAVSWTVKTAAGSSVYAAINKTDGGWYPATLISPGGSSDDSRESTTQSDLGELDLQNVSSVWLNGSTVQTNNYTAKANAWSGPRNLSTEAVSELTVHSEQDNAGSMAAWIQSNGQQLALAGTAAGQFTAPQVIASDLSNATNPQAASTAMAGWESTTNGVTTLSAVRLPDSEPAP